MLALIDEDWEIVALHESQDSIWQLTLRQVTKFCLIRAHNCSASHSGYGTRMPALLLAESAATDLVIWVPVDLVRCAVDELPE